MSEELKRWIPVCFPMGPFEGTVNLALKGSNVLTATEAKELIDKSEEQLNASKVHANWINGDGDARTETKTEV